MSATTNHGGSVVTVLETDAARLHTYTSPEDSFLVNTHVIESEHRLVIVDGQFFQPNAARLADYVETLGKPVERIILSHVHPDHYSGLQTLRERLPEVPVYALAEVKDYVDRYAGQVLAARREAFGDVIADQAPTIDSILTPGEETIDGVTYRFEHRADVESQHNLVLTLPDAGALAPSDFVFHAEHHMFTVQPYFDEWVEQLRALQNQADRTPHLLVGHGVPSDPSVIDANIDYLQRAKAAHAQAGDAEAYSAILKEQFPDRTQTAWADFSGLMLYGIINP